MCHAACKVEFQPFNRSYSQLILSFVCCAFSQQIGRGHVYVEYPKSAKSTAIEHTQEVLRVKREVITFPGKLFLYVLAKMSIDLILVELTADVLEILYTK